MIWLAIAIGIVLFALVVAVVVELPKAKNPCKEILGGMAMKRCELEDGHDGPHMTHWLDEKVWFKTGQNVVPLSKL